MATSGTYSFFVTRDQIISAAMRKCMSLTGGNTPNTNDLTNLSFALNTILKNLVVEGYELFCYYTVSNTLDSTGTVQTYKIGPTNGDGTFNNVARPLRIPQAWVQQTGNNFRIPVQLLSRDEFQKLTPNTQVGPYPVNFYYDPQTVPTSTGTTLPNVGIIWTWPVCNQTGNTLYVSSQRPIQDIDSGGSTSTQNFDLPQEWFLPLVYLLAADIAPEYSVNLSKIQMLESRAQTYLDKVVNFSREEASVYFTIDAQMRNS